MTRRVWKQPSMEQDKGSLRPKMTQMLMATVRSLEDRGKRSSPRRLSARTQAKWGSGLSWYTPQGVEPQENGRSAQRNPKDLYKASRSSR